MTTPNFLCQDCGKDVLAAGEWVVLAYDTWMSAWPETEDPGVLCISCIERRIGRPLTGEDIRSPNAAGVPLSPYLKNLWLHRSGQDERRARLGITIEDDHSAC